MPDEDTKRKICEENRQNIKSAKEKLKLLRRGKISGVRRIDPETEADITDVMIDELLDRIAEHQKIIDKHSE